MQYLCNFSTFSLVSFLLVAWDEIVYFAIIVIIDCWIISTICIWNTSCAYIVLLSLAFFQHIVYVLLLIFHLTVDLFPSCYSWLLRHLGLLFPACLAKHDHFLALQRIHICIYYFAQFLPYICLIVSFFCYQLFFWCPRKDFGYMNWHYISITVCVIFVWFFCSLLTGWGF